jgi:hypothetical protein
MDDAIPTEMPAADPPAVERYVLLADISELGEPSA